MEETVDAEAETDGAPTADINGDSSSDSSGDSGGISGGISGGSGGDTRASATKRAAVLEVSLSQTTEPRRAQVLMVGTGTWICPSAPMETMPS